MYIKLMKKVRRMMNDSSKKHLEYHHCLVIIITIIIIIRNRNKTEKISKGNQMIEQLSQCLNFHCLESAEKYLNFN